MFDKIIRRLSVCTLLTAAVLLTSQLPQAAAQVAERPGWVVVPTGHSYKDLTNRVQQAAEQHKIGVVAAASATVGIKKLLDKEVAGNVVIGLYHPRFAIRMLEASTAAGIEAPIRIYITENADGTATLSYKTPSHVFAPYMDEGGDELKALADELDALFAALVKDAAG
ncbi:MAG: DUF302 domain-containing protein [Aestuariivirgaceae bacterium]